MLTNPTLSNDLKILKSQVARLIELQQEENKVPNPPGFVDQIRAYHNTILLDDLERIEDHHRELSKKTKEKFDAESAREEKLCSLILTIADKLKGDGFKPPKQKVVSFPYKTRGGREMETCWDRVQSCCTSIPLEIVTNLEAINAKKIMDECLEVIEQHFSPLAKWDTGERPLMDEFYQHYFVGMAHLAIKRTVQQIDKNQEVALLRSLWRTFKLWFGFVWRKLEKKGHSKAPS